MHTHASAACFYSSASRRFSVRASRWRLRPSGPWWLRSASTLTWGEAVRSRVGARRACQDLDLVSSEGRQDVPVAARIGELAPPAFVRHFWVVRDERQGAKLGVSDPEELFAILLGQGRPVDGHRHEVPVGKSILEINLLSKRQAGETDAPPEGWSRVCVLPCGRQAVRILADWLSRRVLSKNPSIRLTRLLCLVVGPKPL
jgi:hypothetical protein